jgi:hypothetical protein
MAHAGGRPLKFQSVEELQQKITEYFDGCFDYKRDMFGGRIQDKVCVGEIIKKDGTVQKKWENKGFVMEQVKAFTVSGLAVYLGTTRDTLIDYESGRYDDKLDSELTDEERLINEQVDKFSDTIKAAKSKIYAYTEESLFGRAATGSIFSLKNNYNWKDKTETDITTNGEPINPMASLTVDELKKLANR